MDKQNRLTKWDEWEIGAHYEWVKGKTPIGNWTCTEVNKREGCVRMISDDLTVNTKAFNWQKRYRKL